MWRDALELFHAHRGTLAAAGIPLHARVEQDAGLMCTYRQGVVRLALPDPTLAGGELRAAMNAALLGISLDEAVWLFRAQLPRLVAHEIGHAVRAEHGTTSADPWIEEQAAERFANLLSRPYLAASTRAALRDLLAPVVARLGGLAPAAACHRSARARTLPEVVAVPAAPAPDPSRYHDLPTFLRLAVAWAYLDLLLDEEDTLDACRTDLLVAA